MTAPETTTTITGPERKPRDNEIDVFGITHAGKVRKENQDHFLICALKKQMAVRQTSLPDIGSLEHSGAMTTFYAGVKTIRISTAWPPR